MRSARERPWSIGALVGPFLAGLLYDLTRSYDLAFVVGGILLLVGAASVYVWGSHKGKTGHAGRAATETEHPGE